MSTLTPLEEQVMNMLLSGEEEALAILREQLALSTVSSREMTGVGFFTNFAVPADAPRLVGRQSFELTDVEGTASNLERGMGFVLFVRGGALDFLEGFSYAAPWPEELRDVTLAYLISKDSKTSMISPDGKRDMEDIRAILQKR